MSLIVEKVSKRFGRTPGLTGISFVTGPGEIVAVLGPSGAGKTPLMRVVSGEWPPSEGYIRVGGEPLSHFSRHLVASSGDQRIVFHHFTGADYRRMWKLLYPQFDDALFAVFAKRFSWDLSRRLESLPMGERSLFLTLGALTCRPLLLLIDEPFQHLTPYDRETLCGLLRSYADEHRATVILSSSELYEQEPILDRGGVLKNGRLLCATRLDEARRAHRMVSSADEASDFLTVGPVLAEWLVFCDEEIGRVPTLAEIVTGYLNGASS